MKHRHRRLLPLLFAAVVALCWLNQRRTMGMRDAMNPVFWARRWQGRDLFEERGQVLLHGNRALREVALTIDDGPYPSTAPAMLDVLKAHGVRATFFLVGERIKDQPEQVLRMLAEGHEVGNHSQTHHHRLDTLEPRHIRNELNFCEINFNRVTDRHFSLMRPPGVRYNADVLNVANELGYVTVSWNVGAKDYDHYVNADYIVNRVLRRVENGSIILLHDGKPATVSALPRILVQLARDGYKFLTISEMLAHLPYRAP